MNKILSNKYVALDLLGKGNVPLTGGPGLASFASPEKKPLMPKRQKLLRITCGGATLDNFFSVCILRSREVDQDAD